MKVRDLMVITSYLSGTTDKPLRVRVTNADGTKQDCDIKDVTQFCDALVLNISTDFFFKESKGSKFQLGQSVIHKDDDSGIVYQPHQIIQVDNNERKYRLDNGSVIHFSNEDDYEVIVQTVKEIEKKYYNKALEDVLDVLQGKAVKCNSDVSEILQKLHIKDDEHEF